MQIVIDRVLRALGNVGLDREINCFPHVHGQNQAKVIGHDNRLWSPVIPMCIGSIRTHVTGSTFLASFRTVTVPAARVSGCCHTRPAIASNLLQPLP